MRVQGRSGMYLACFVTLLAVKLAAAAPLNVTAVIALNHTLSGYVIATAQDPGYNVAHRTWNYLQQGVDPVLPFSEPAVYVVASGIPDVLVALEFAIEYGLKTSFIANGHSFGDASLLSGGMTIDVLSLQYAAVYHENKTGFFQPGVKGGDWGNLTGQYNLMFPTTHATGVGIAGFTLGCGNGWGFNRVGVAVDNVLAFDVVNTWEYNTTGKLEVVTVSADSYPDLFWGLRGAGQNLAAVVGFHVQLHDLPPDNLVPTVTTIFPLSMANQAYAQWLEWKETAPFTLENTIIMSPIGPREYGVVFALYNWDPTGEDEKSAAALQDWAVRANATGAVEVVAESVPWDSVLSSLDASQDFPGNAAYVYAPFVDPEALDLDLFAELAAHYASASGGPNRIILISDTTENVGVSNSDTAFGFRNQTNIWVWGMWTRSAGGAPVDGDATYMAWVEQGREILQPFANGQYINAVHFTSANDTQFSYPPENWARVKEVKAEYDGMNLFRDLYYWRPKMSGSADFSQQDIDGAVTFASI